MATLDTVWWYSSPCMGPLTAEQLFTVMAILFVFLPLGAQNQRETENRERPSSCVWIFLSQGPTGSESQRLRGQGPGRSSLVQHFCLTNGETEVTGSRVSQSRWTCLSWLSGLRSFLCLLQLLPPGRSEEGGAPESSPRSQCFRVKCRSLGPGGGLGLWGGPGDLYPQLAHLTKVLESLLWTLSIGPKATDLGSGPLLTLPASEFTTQES